MKDVDALERFLADIDEILATVRSMIPAASRIAVTRFTVAAEWKLEPVRPVDLMRWCRRSILEIGDSDATPPASRN